MKKKYDIKWALVLRFLRATIPQLVLIMPVLITRGQEFSEYLPVWVVPTLIMIGGVLTAVDKWLREIGFYEETKAMAKDWMKDWIG